jgi:hypothetical protein
MTKNRTLALTNPLEFVSKHFQLTGSSLKAAIRVHRSGIGYYATVDTSVFDRSLFGTIQQIGDMRPERRPVYALKQRMTVYNLETDTSEETWIYKSKSGAIVALLLHLLMNVHSRTGTSWSFKYLMNTKELIVLVPESECLGTMQVVATIFRTTKTRGTKVFARYFDNTGTALPPMVIGKDNIGAFDGSFLS